MRVMGRGAHVALPLLLLVPACSGDPTPPDAVTADEERQLNEAAAMLDANGIAIDDTITEEAPQ
jgi:hypothetical protein